MVQTPKVTMFNGQSSTCEAIEQKTFVTGVDIRTASNGNTIFQPIVEEIPVGIRMTARPVISADRRSVNVSLSVNLSKLDDPEFDLSEIKVPALNSGEDGKPGRAIYPNPPAAPHLQIWLGQSRFTIRDGSAGAD